MWSVRWGRASPWAQTSSAPLCSALQLPLFASAGVEEWIFKASWLCSVIFQTATLTWVRLSVL